MSFSIPRTGSLSRHNSHSSLSSLPRVPSSHALSPVHHAESFVNCHPLSPSKSASGMEGKTPGPGTTSTSPFPPITGAATPLRKTHTSASNLQQAETMTSDLQGYILESPILEQCGIGRSLDMMAWLEAGQRLAFQLGFDHDNLDSIQRLRIYHYYLPIYFWCQSQLAAHKSSGKTTALVLGISAPQGCGKTTVVEQLEQLFAWSGRNAASVSIDDFYLSYQDQSNLAKTNEGNKLLKLRGNAGSHDMALGSETIKALRDLQETGTSMKVPRYDKSAYSGLGDRAPVSQWPAVDAPVDIILFEGWMLGFSALSDDQVLNIDSDLVKVNSFLREYDQTWDSLVDSWLVIRIGDPQWVFKWRLQAEERMRESGKAGMSDEQIADFVSRFMPAYKAYLPQLYASGPTTCKKGHTLVIEVDQNRSPVANQPAPVHASQNVSALN